ncbi:apolipoprotein A1/A4/E family protein [Kineococcus aurantiacus]|uniref:F0F1-type ATP synthase membrane subunit b/b n=1 Tax=Kineococcus aurantiacus TaxID=37633 RepID=A0A7Y9DM36_9ACTN|nr:apolipoprotein A1/A4/E family protein [Kineococcus aurantiacus]NYD23118.1 F0F1-type ATP synthase membrane subunit b/b' [Kineococcus aurantiacus]
MTDQPRIDPITGARLTDPEVPAATYPPTGVGEQVGATAVQPPSTGTTGAAKEQASEVAGTAKEQASAVAGTAKEQASAVAGTAKEQASAVAGTAKEQASEVAGTAQQGLSEVVGEARDQVGDLLEGLRQQLSEQSDSVRDRLAEFLREAGSELAGMAEAGGRSGYATQVVRQVGDRASAWGAHLDQHDAPALLDQGRSFARRKPGAFILGALVAGVVAGRLTRGGKAHHDATTDTTDVDAAPRHAVEGPVDPAATAALVPSGISTRSTPVTTTPGVPVAPTGTPYAEGVGLPTTDPSGYRP